jgi:nitrate/TMAO reductase-like tetraheme cytochrome c subunit
MSQQKSWREWLVPLLVLSSNWISAIGVVLVTASAIFWLVLMASNASPHHSNPYVGILLWVLAPAVFFLGLALIPLGIAIQRRKSAREGHEPPPLTFDFADVRVRRFAVFLGMTTFANIVIASYFGYSSVSYMDSTSFCGLTCHTVMAPEYTAYQNSPHSRVDCVQCHIGPGAGWFVKSKLSGTRQLLAVTFNTYHRPVESPIPDLRPSRDTCEGCHWPEKFGGERLRVITKYSDDEANTKTQTVLMMHIGGPRTKGIHGAHVGAGVQISYGHTDRQRQNIAWVKATRANGEVIEYSGKDAKPEDAAKASTRVMDCVDCHNRPTHVFELPERGLDRVMNSGEAPTDLPFFKKQGVELLKASYSTQKEALDDIPKKLEQFYQQKYPDVYARRGEDIRRAGKALASVYGRNVWPEMKIEWGTYLNNIGHTDAVGCFRCHDDEHKSKAGVKITQDCSTCHEMIAMDEANPKILTDLGLNPPPPPNQTAKK